MPEQTPADRKPRHWLDITGSPDVYTCRRPVYIGDVGYAEPCGYELPCSEHPAPVPASPVPSRRAPEPDSIATAERYLRASGIPVTETEIRAWLDERGIPVMVGVWPLFAAIRKAIIAAGDAGFVEACRASEPDTSPDRDSVYLDVNAGHLTVTQTTGRTLAVAVNGEFVTVPDRVRTTIELPHVRQAVAAGDAGYKAAELRHPAGSPGALMDGTTHSFGDGCRGGHYATFEDAVAAWHELPETDQRSKKEIYQFLGMSWDDYREIAQADKAWPAAL